MAGTDNPIAPVSQRVLEAAQQAKAAALAHQKLLDDAVDGGQHCASAVGIPGSKLLVSGLHHFFGKPSQSKVDDVDACVKSAAEVAKTVGPPLEQKLKEAAHAAAPLGERVKEAALKAKQRAEAALHPASGPS
jgi:hypothetical protein